MPVLLDYHADLALHQRSFYREGPATRCSGRLVGSPATSLFVTDKRIKGTMRTRSSRLPASFSVPARLLRLYSSNVERLTLAVENDEYQVSSLALSAAMMGEHLSR